MKMTVVDSNEDHFIVAFDSPGRIEISLVNGRIMAHVYKGEDIDLEQSPVGAYDGTLEYNEDWSKH